MIVQVKTILLVFAFACPSLLFVQQNAAPNPVMLTVDQALDHALSYNLGYAIEESKVTIKKREKDFSWNKFIPSLTLGSNLVRLNKDLSGSGVTAAGSPNAYGLYSVYPYSYSLDPWNLSMSFSAQLTLSFATLRQIDQAAIDYEASVLSFETAKKKLERDVRKSFNQLLALKDAIALTRKQIDNAQQRYLQAQATYKSGLASSLSVLQSQVALENKKPALQDQELGYRQALMAFAILLGFDARQSIDLKGNVDVPQDAQGLDPDVFIDRYLDRRLDVQAAWYGVKSVQNSLRLQEALRLPSLSIGFSADPTVANLFGTNPKTGKATDISDGNNWAQSSGNFFIGLRWQPDALIPGLSNWVSSEGLKDSIAQAKLGAEQARRAGAMEITGLVDRIRKSVSALQTLDLNVQLAQKAYQQTDTAYKAGNQTLLEVQDADVQLQAAQLQVINEKLNLANNMLDLGYALNADPKEYLQGVPK